MTGVGKREDKGGRRHTVKDFLVLAKDADLRGLANRPIPNFTASDVLLLALLDVDAEDLRDLRFANHALRDKRREVLG